MARPTRLVQFNALPDGECDERVVHLAAVQKARAQQPPATDLRQLVDLLGVLADPTRLRIVAALNSVELCVCDLSATIGISESAVSHQLRLMRDLKIVRTRRDGRRVFYSLDDDHVTSIFSQARDHISHSPVADAGQ
jgi:ArsR family transcriptional regulator, lead/cadmium/zinc/bismuth-responsive transcriptional repressor